MGVHKGISDKHILEYLNNDKIQYKKIVTTPESFDKIIIAVYNSNFTLYQDFFLLFDECDRIVKDVDFRESITDPLFHFFQFEQKAFISATAIKPSDPLFEKNNFTYLSIVPNYLIEKKIKLITTNNPYNVLQELFEKNKGKKNFIFLNSTKAIEKFIAHLKIQSKSAIFCSDKSLESIAEAVAYSGSTLDEEQFKEYNFFTSRFFSAVDFDIDYDCNVYLVTDIHTAEYSAIDPHTDAIQIIGRFRNTSIDLNISVITNSDENLNCRTVEDSILFLKCTESIYNTILNYKKGNTNKTILEVLNMTLEVLPFKQFLDKRGQKSHFKFDNFIHNNKVLSCYSNYDTILAAYSNCHIIGQAIKYFDITHETKDFFYDSTMMTFKKLFKSYHDNLKKIIRLYVALNNPKIIEDKKYQTKSILNSVELYFPEVFEALSLLNEIDELSECKSKEEVLLLIKRHKKAIERNSMPFIEDIREEFPVKSCFTGDAFRKRMKLIIDKHKLNLDPSIKEGKNFLEISERFKGKGINRNVWFYRVKSHK